MLILIATGIVQGKQADSPPSPYISEGACPFECCTYREWIANRDLAVMDKPNGRPIGQLRKHEHVSGITGEIVTHPLRFQIKRKGPDKEAVSVPVGSTIYLLHPEGEGFWLVWFRGKVIRMDPQYIGPGPRYQWWARIKGRSGQVGWVRMNVNDLPFEQVDGCA